MEQDKKLIIQSPFGDDNRAVIVGASENKTSVQLRTDFVAAAAEFGDEITKIAKNGSDLTSVVKDGTRYETFSKNVILELEEQMAQPFPQYKNGY